jgi:hypothetical protein
VPVIGLVEPGPVERVRLADHESLIVPGAVCIGSRSWVPLRASAAASWEALVGQVAACDRLR